MATTPTPTPTADVTETTTGDAALEATGDAVTETAPAKVKVKSIFKNPMYLSCGELLFEKEAEITYAEFCNLAGTYVEKV